MKDSTRAGMQSVMGGMEAMEKQIAQQSSLIKKLEADLKAAETAFARAQKAGADQSQNIETIRLLRKEVADLKKELADLADQQKKTAATPVASAAAPQLDMKKQIAEVKENIAYMEKYVKEREKIIKKTAPGKEKNEMVQELTGAKAALDAEKQALAELQLQSASTASAQTTLRTQILNLKNEMGAMTEGTEEYRLAMERLGRLQDRYADVTMQGKIFADDNKHIKATMDTMSGLTGAMTAGVGVASLFGASQEKLTAIQTRLQAVMAITMGVQQVANTLNKDSYFTHVLLAKAKTLLTAANARLAAALGISTVAAQALMATLTLGLSVAITAIIVGLSKLSTANAKAAADTKKFNESAASGASNQRVEFEKLRREWVAAGNDLKKKEDLVRKNTEAYNQFGAKIRDVNEADNMFINNADAFAKAINARAMAAAAMELAAEKYKKAMEKMLEADAMPDKVPMPVYAGRQFASPLDNPMQDNSYKTQTIEEASKLGEEAVKITTMSLGYDEKSRKMIADAGADATEDIEKGTKADWENIKKTQQGFMDAAMPDSDKFKEAKKLRDEAIKELTKWDDKPTNNENAFNRLRDLQEKYVALVQKQAVDRARLEQDTEMQAAQAHISAMADGAEKVAAQRDLDNKKEIDALKRQKADYIRNYIAAQKELFDTQEEINAAQDKNYKKKQFDASGITVDTAAIDGIIGDTELKQWRDQIAEQETAWNEYLQKYGDFEQKRAAIRESYQKRIASAVTAGEKASLNKEMEKMLKELDFEEFTKSINFEAVFSNLEKVGTASLERLHKQLKEYIGKVSQDKDFRPSDLKSLTDAFDDIESQLAQRNPFARLRTSAGEYTEAQAAVAKAQEELNTVMTGGEVITGTYIDSTGKIVTKLLTQTQAEKNLANAQDNRRAKLVKINESLQATVQKGREYQEVATAVLDALDEFGVQLPEEIRGVVSSFGDMLSGLESIDVTRPATIITGAIKTLAGVGKMAANVLSLGGIDFGGQKSVARYEAAKQMYESYMSVLDRVIGKQKELVASMDTSDYANANNSYQKALDLIAAQEKSARELGRQYLDSGASKGFMGIGSSASKGTKQREGISSAAWQEYEALKKNKEELKEIGLTIDQLNAAKEGRMSGLFDLSAEQLEYIMTNAPTFWAQLHDDTKQYLEAVIAAGETWEDIQKARKESLTKTDYDSFYKSFVDLLADMDSSSKDFANNFEKHFQKALLSSLMSTKYNKKLEELYNSWADQTESGGKLTEEEAAELREKQRKLAEEMLADRDQMMKDFGWTSTSSQTGRAGAFTAMSQEQGTKLEGLFTSLQDHASSIDEQVIDISRMMSLASDHLAEISKNTAYCKHLEQMAGDIAAMKLNMQDGVRMK